MVTPAQGSLGAGTLLEQLQTLSVTVRNETSQASRFILLTAEGAYVFIGVNYSLFLRNKFFTVFDRLSVM
jgi:hypothetical protein